MNFNKINIIGFGNQAKAWALNLRDSGLEIKIWLREQSASLPLVQKMGFNLYDAQVSHPEVYALLIPDHEHKIFFQNNSLPKGSIIILAHGFSLFSQNLATHYPEYDFVLMAPKAIASELRFQYELKGEIAAFYSLEYVQHNQDIQENLLGLAKKLGITKGPFHTTAREETYADLFSEQAILCSVLPYVSNLCYEALRKRGYSKEISYYECFFEVYLIAKVLIQKGPEEFFNLISPNALIGSEKGKNTLLDEEFSLHMEKLLDDIESGQFEYELDKTDLHSQRQKILKYWKNAELTQTFKDINQ